MRQLTTGVPGILQNVEAGKMFRLQGGETNSTRHAYTPRQETKRVICTAKKRDDVQLLCNHRPRTTSMSIETAMTSIGRYRYLAQNVYLRIYVREGRNGVLRATI